MRNTLVIILLLLFSHVVHSQGVTTGTLEGRVREVTSRAMAGTSVIALHIPSGTKYCTVTREDGSYSFPGMRVGGPYLVTSSFTGYKNALSQELFITLGNTTRQDFTMIEQATELNPVVVSAGANETSSTIRGRDISSLPTINRLVSDFTRLLPLSRGTLFTGKDNRLNALTVDGSLFNNSFGIVGMPGERTGVSPLSYEAIEQVGISIASMDARLANYTGASINIVTKSGDNDFKASAYYNFRNEAFVGKRAAGSTFNVGTFRFNLEGGNVSGPIIRDKLFFFIGLEAESYIRPATLFRANDGSQNVEGNITRVLKSDLDELSSYLREKFGYETGLYERYDFTTKALRFITKLDYNLNDRNKLTLRYNHLNSSSDQFIANTDILGSGYRRGSVNSLNFQNSNYSLVENIRSIIGELNSTFSSKLINNLIIGYRHHDESRENPPILFPTVDILKDGTTYTTFGTEPFTPYNVLKYSTFQFQNNLSIYLGGHALLTGFNFERFSSINSFFPAAQGVYVYNSLADFYEDANGYFSDPSRTTSTVNLRKFQYQYANIPNMEKPFQRLNVFYAGLYLQDKFNISQRVRLTLGFRVDLPFFGKTGYRNSQVEQLSFRDEKGREVKYSTDKLPNPNPLFSPRVGMEWEIKEDGSLMLRCGVGVFTSQPPYILISNQIGNNGILTGLEWLESFPGMTLHNRPFTPELNAYKPSNITGAPAARYNLALTDPAFKFPQILRSNIFIKRRMPWDIIGNFELIYDKDINGIGYVNVNLPQADSRYLGADSRPRWSSGNRINNNITDAILLKNHNKGYSWNLSASLEKRVADKLFGKIGYSYGKAFNLIDVETVAYSSWSYNTQVNDPNNPQLGLSLFTPDHRAFGFLSYKTDNYKFGSTTFTLFFDTFSGGRQSYIVAGDLNGDGAATNDLIYIPKDKTEMTFKEYTSGGKLFTVAQQQEAWERYIEQDRYLRNRRGEYAQRNGVRLPMISRFDMSISQRVSTRILGRENSFTIRLDLLNLNNLLNRNWGVAKILTSNQPLIFVGTETSGTEVRPMYNLQSINGELIKNSLVTSSTLNDVYRFQLSIRWDL